MIDRKHTWPWAIFFAGSICCVITVDILQHAAPLPFLPQQLEERGHSSLEIAAVMGGYYWMGFLGGSMITLYQIYGLLYGAYQEPTWRALRSHVLKLGVFLMLGSATLLVEARASDNEYARMHTVHLNCRLAQGFLGSFLFFYAYFLAATAFEGSQQVFALTLATISLNVAEVFGPFLGAWIFSWYGLDMTYYLLAALSILNNVLLVFVWLFFPKDDEPEMTSTLDTSNIEGHQGTPSTNRGRSPRFSPRGPSGSTSPHLGPATGPRTPLTPGRTPPASRPHSPRSSRAWLTLQPNFQERCLRVQRALTDSWLLRSLLVIGPAAMVKSSFESILPLFGSNHGFSEFEVGLLFTGVAIGFIIASVTLGFLWEYMSSKARLISVSLSLFLLGGVACVMLYTWGMDADLPKDVSQNINMLNGDHHYLFYGMLVVYGLLLGVTHTGAALYLGDVIDELADERSKGAANGVWNTGWELGGSIGFFVAGLADTDSWRQEQQILTIIGFVAISACACFLLSIYTPFHGGLEDMKEFDEGLEDETKPLMAK